MPLSATTGWTLELHEPAQTDRAMEKPARGGPLRRAALLLLVSVLCSPQTVLQAEGTRAPRASRDPLRSALAAVVLRGGGGSDARPSAPVWDPPCLGVVSSRAIQQLASRARESPTGEEVFEMAKRVHPHDKALALGVQNMSIYGHAHTIRRLQDFKHYSERVAPETAQLIGARLLRYRKRLRKWGLQGFYSDTLMDEMMRSNRSYCDDAREIRPPKGWRLHRPAEERAIFAGVDQELLNDPNNATWLAAKGILTLWVRGLRPLYGDWDPRDECAPVDEAVDLAEKLLCASLRADPTNALVRCHYGKLLEAFRGDYDGAEAQYLAALSSDPNHIPALTFYSYFLRDLRNDTAGFRKIQGRKDLLMDPCRLHERNSDVYFDPAVYGGDLRPLFSAIARGTSEIGPTAITPWEFLRVPGPTEHELRRLGYTRQEARALEGGPQHFRLASETAGLWHWHGFYQQFWKNRGRRYQPYCPFGHKNGTRHVPCRLALLKSQRSKHTYHTDERLVRWVEWERGAAGGYFIGADGEPSRSVGVCMCVMCSPHKDKAASNSAPPGECAAVRRTEETREGLQGSARCWDSDPEASSEWDDDNSTASLVENTF